MRSLQFIARSFSPHPVLSLVVAPLLALTVALGVWQLNRAGEKQNLLSLLDAPLLPVAAEGQLPADATVTRRRAVLSGRFVPGRDLLLDNSPRQGVPGLAVISPFQLRGGGTILVFRGWLPAVGQRRDFAAALPPLADEDIAAATELRVELSPPPASLLRLSEASPGWPKLIVRLDPRQIARELRQPVAATVAWSLDQVGSLPLPPRPSQGFSPARHFGYALQWFGLAAVLLLGYLWQGFSRTRAATT